MPVATDRAAGPVAVLIIVASALLAAQGNRTAAPPQGSAGQTTEWLDIGNDKGSTQP